MLAAIGLLGLALGLGLALTRYRFQPGEEWIALNVFVGAAASFGGGVGYFFRRPIQFALFAVAAAIVGGAIWVLGTAMPT